MTDKSKPFVLSLSRFAVKGIYDMEDPRCSRCYYHWLQESRPGQLGSCTGNANERPCADYHPPLNKEEQAKSMAAFEGFIQTIDSDDAEPTYE